MGKKINFAIIGTSGVAPGHIKAIQMNPKAEVIYVYSRDRERALEFAKRYRLTPARFYEEILSDKSIDAVDIVTEPSRHARLALEAIRAGKHVLIEKPLDTDITLAEELLIAASKSSQLISVISQKRFDPKLSKMKKDLENGVIGIPFLAEVRMLWRRTQEYYWNGDGWRARVGNVLINQAIHWLDIAAWFFGFPEKVRALTWKVKSDITCYDTAVCSLEFPNQLLFNLVCSTAVNQSQRDEFKIYGTKGMLDYNCKRTLSFLRKPEPLLQYQIDDFINSILEKKPPAVSVRDAYNALRIVKLCEANAA